MADNFAGKFPRLQQQQTFRCENQVETLPESTKAYLRVVRNVIQCFVFSLSQSRLPHPLVVAELTMSEAPLSKF